MPFTLSLNYILIHTGFMEALDLELKFLEKNITVTKVCPGVVIDTPLLDHAVMPVDER